MDDRRRQIVEATWRFRRAVGAVAVGTAVCAAAVGVTLAWRVVNSDVPIFMLVEPVVLLVFAAWSISAARSFFDPARSGISPSRPRGGRRPDPRPRT